MDSEYKQVGLILVVIIGIIVVLPLIPKVIRELKGPDPDLDEKNLVQIKIAISEYLKVRGTNPESLDALAPMYIGVVPRTADGQSFLYDPYTATAEIPAALQQNTGWSPGGSSAGITPMGDAMTGMSVAEEMNY